jgi:hypothetical protein
MGATAIARASTLLKSQNFDLQGTIQYQRDCVRDKKFDILGRVTNLRLGIDDNAEYFRGDAFRRVSRDSKVYGLQLEWHQDEAPWIGFCADKQTCVFPYGIVHLPTIVATMFTDLRVKLESGKYQTATRGDSVPRMPQRLSDYASGRLMDVRGEKGFVVLQPVEQVIVFSHMPSGGRAGSMLNLKGSAVLGRHPFLMVNPFGTDAYIAGGSLNFGR